MTREGELGGERERREEKIKNVHFPIIYCHVIFGRSGFWGIGGRPQNLSSPKPPQAQGFLLYISHLNVLKWYTIDALGAIFAIFTILDTFTKL